MGRESLRFCLLQARNPGDLVREEECQAFADRLGVRREAVRGVDVLSQELGRHLLEGADALLVGGAGEYSVCTPTPAIHNLMDFLGEVAQDGIPIFASCFGFQCLVVALGGEVIHDAKGAEVGSTEVCLTEAGRRDPLFSLLPARFIAQQGHKDRASRLPQVAVCMAENQNSPYQALRLKGRPVFATQFHPELTGSTNRQRFERYIEDYGEVFGVNRARRMLEEFQPSPEASGLLERFADWLVGENSADGQDEEEG